MPRTRAIRVAAIVSLMLLAVLGWCLGSPLFVRTSVFEAFPTTIATAAPRSSDTPAVATSSIPTIARPGELQYVDRLNNGTGQVQLIRTGESHVLRFENVAITNAPDVHVYLSRETGGSWKEATSLYLGPLKATNGSFNYEISRDADLAPYRSVVVWCRAFAVLVTWAELGQPSR